MKNLPLGIQTFSKIIKDNCLYVDKTEDILRLINSGEYFFMSRPRRFGKSLLISTLEEIFSGNRELFSGLYIYDKIEWEKYPVIHIDFSMIAHNDSEILKKSISSFITGISDNYNIKLSSEFPGDKLRELLQKISEIKNKKIVILIDEYDKPIIDYIDDKEKSKKNREVLKDFYTVLKGCDKYLKFLFLTGVSKFSKVSVFSGLNNLKDITLDGKFSTILGITEKEIKKYFQEHLKQLQKKEKTNKKKTLEEIKYWYNGYSWDGVNKVYNPHSILNLFSSMRFSNYWFSTGTPDLLIKLIKEQKYEITGIENNTAGEYIFDTYDIENLELTSLLFQTGYLTISKVTKENRIYLYTLNYPNYEVKESFLNYLLADFTKEPVSSIQPLYLSIKDALNKEDLEKAIKIIKSMFAGIPYTLHIEKEAYYHSIFYIILSLLGVKFDAEVLTDRGRIDGVLELSDKIYVMEFKYGREGSEPSKLTEEAINQIKDRKYYEKFLNKEKKLLFLALTFSGKEINYKIDRDL